MPMYGRASFWPASACCMIGRAMLIGIAKPIPLLLAAIAVLIPMTLPAASRSGPPLLPGLIAASVWMRFVSCWAGGPSTVIVRPFADTMPLVALFEYVPGGVPVATTRWPTLRAGELPTAAVGRPAERTL